MNAVFLPVFTQDIWVAVVIAGFTAVGFAASEWIVRRHARAKYAAIRVKSRPSRRSR